MNTYLIHLNKDGTPVGVHSETDSVYLPGYAAAEVYGKGVVGSRGSNVTWEDWCAQLSEQALALRARWLPYRTTLDNISQVLADAASSASYED